MKCVSCGSDLLADAKFCQKCGAKAPGASGESPGVDRMKQAAARSKGDDAEQDLWQGGYSGKAMFGSWLVACVVTVAAIVAATKVPNRNAVLAMLVLAGLLWLWLLGQFLYRKLGIHYQLTDQRLVHRRGILMQATDRIEVIDIDDVSMSQSLFERILNVGSIKITSSDRSDPELVMVGINNVREVTSLIDDTRRSERRRRGIHIETI